MQAPNPFFREAGSGPGVVCLHSNASHSGQWRALSERLAPGYHVLAADGYGAGKSPAWRAKRPVRLRDEVDLLEPVFARAGDPFVLVGHSYGGAVALIAAITHPRRVRALVLYEPTLFALVDADAPAPNEADGIRQTVADSVAALAAGDRDRAAQRFIDFWMGKGAWQRMPEARRAPIADSVTHVRAWGKALFNEPTPLAAFAALNVPVLYMLGKDSPASSRAVAQLLIPVLPQVQVVEFEGAGHMGPMTHADRINDTIAGFLHTEPRLVRVA
ncbi:MAG TPA: alpha/beta hydrolase [Burkholderiaceae bacterium]|nr:alpha/beta hydrolase [Burkholderiaceae bacterium]